MKKYLSTLIVCFLLFLNCANQREVRKSNNFNKIAPCNLEAEIDEFPCQLDDILIIPLFKWNNDFSIPFIASFKLHRSVKKF